MSKFAGPKYRSGFASLSSAGTWPLFVIVFSAFFWSDRERRTVICVLFLDRQFCGCDASE